MPSTSRSWSTVAKRPLRVRHSTIRCAVTGPTPGRASSCSTVAAFRSSGPAGPLPPPPVAGTGPASGAGGTPIATCSPSPTFRARFTPLRSASGRGPPAASSTSATRDPGATRTSPGRRTFPATATTRVSGSTAVTADGAAAALVVTCTGRSATGSARGASRQTPTAATTAARTPTSTTASAPGRPGSIRTSRQDLGSHRSVNRRPARPGRGGIAWTGIGTVGESSKGASGTPDAGGPDVTPAPRPAARIRGTGYGVPCRRR